MDWQVLDLSILGPAFIAGLLVLSTHVPLGRIVLKRGIIFIDLAVAQIAGLGVIAAELLGWNDNPWQVQLAAVTTAVLGALLLRLTEKYFPKTQEALIGVMFVLAATLSLLLLANNPHGGEHLKDLLVGQILWVSYEELIPPAIIYSVILFSWFGLQIGEKFPSAFYLVFAVAVTVSVQLVGVYLVFTSLIIPALVTSQYHGVKQLWIAFVIGAIAYAIGLVVSALFDLPSGAVIVWSLAVTGVISSLVLAGGNFPFVRKNHKGTD
ncbi:MAG: metal ABC transporter permease [Alteromonadaceae bacterium]|nr:metal ABC transporter permease [Alteromonadaceae bacterium]